MTDYKDYSIGDVAKKLNVPVHTVRYWTETFEHIECLKRNGRRYYDEKAIDELLKIKELSHKKGIKIDGIKQMIRYNKINMDKIKQAQQNGFENKIDFCIKKIDKIIEVLSK